MRPLRSTGEIYKYMPNDTDLTPALAAGLPGVNFAFIGDVAAYHTPLDRRENLDPRSLQQQGDNMLAMADGLRRAAPSQLKSGGLIYLDILGRWLPRAGPRTGRCHFLFLPLPSSRSRDCSSPRERGGFAQARAGGADATASAGGRGRHGFCAAWPGGMDFRP